MSACTTRMTEPRLSWRASQLRHCFDDVRYMPGGFCRPMTLMASTFVWISTRAGARTARPKATHACHRQGRLCSRDIWPVRRALTAPGVTPVWTHVVRFQVGASLIERRIPKACVVEFASCLSQALSDGPGTFLAGPSTWPSRPVSSWTVKVRPGLRMDFSWPPALDLPGYKVADRPNEAGACCGPRNWHRPPSSMSAAASSRRCQENLSALVEGNAPVVATRPRVTSRLRPPQPRHARHARHGAAVRCPCSAPSLIVALGARL